MEKFYLFEISVILGAVACLAIGYYWKEVARRPSALMWRISLCISVGVALVFADMYLVEPNWIKVERVRISNSELANVLRDATVVQISDLHLWKIGYRERALIEKLNSLRPDLVFITGDLLTEKKGEQAENGFRLLLELIRQIKVKVGIYAVPGNYDGYFSGNAERVGQLAAAGMQVLHNEARKIVMGNGRTVWVVGSVYSVDNVWAEWHFQRAIRALPHEAPVIMLNHYPDAFGRAYSEGIPLVLAGHTHGGQIGIPVVVRMSNSANKSKYISGLFDAGKTKMYINRGIGTTGIAARLFCRPEITVLEFVQ